MQLLKRYLPLLGVAVLVADVVLRSLGLGDVADLVSNVGGAVGATEASPVSGVELSAAITAGAGVVMKVIAEVKKLKNPPPEV